MYEKKKRVQCEEPLKKENLLVALMCNLKRSLINSQISSKSEYFLEKKCKYRNLFRQILITFSFDIAILPKYSTNNLMPERFVVGEKKGNSFSLISLSFNIDQIKLSWS